MTDKPTITQADRDIYEARLCPDIPTDCCDYGVVSHATGKEVCRVWQEDDARLIANLLNENHKTEEQWLLTWTAAPRPPVHPSPMTGRQTFQTFNDAIEFFKRRPKDSRFVSLIEIVTKSIDRTNEANIALSKKD